MYERIKNYLSLAALLIVGIVIAIAEPAGLWAVLLAQALHLAAIGAGAGKLNKLVMNLVVLGVALVLAYLRLDGAFPAFPAYAGDPAAYLQALVDFASAAVAYATPIVGAAVVQYNIIGEKLLVLLGDKVGLYLEPEEDVEE